MAKYLEFKHNVDPVQEAMRGKLAAAPARHTAALLKAYDLLNVAEKHGLLDLLRGAISAEDTILEKVSGYANTPEGIRSMRNLLVLGKLLSSIDPDLLGDGARDVKASIVDESKRKPAGFFATTRRLLGRDALRGLGIAIAALESLGRTARVKAERLAGGSES